jgi:CRISPR-associated protein Cmr5
MSRERKRALQTLRQVESVQSEKGGDAKRYGTLAYKLPVLLRTAGLAQTVAFLASRGDNDQEGKRLVGHLGERLDFGASQDAGEIFKKVAGATTERYLAWTAEAIASADWYVRHVQAVLKIERTAEAGDE